VQLYHSIHARGERVEDVIGLLEAQNEDSDPFMDMQNGAANVSETKSDVREELEDGEVKEGASDAMSMVDGHAGDQEDVVSLFYTSLQCKLEPANVHSRRSWSTCLKLRTCLRQIHRASRRFRMQCRMWLLMEVCLIQRGLLGQIPSLLIALQSRMRASRT